LVIIHFYQKSMISKGRESLGDLFGTLDDSSSSKAPGSSSRASFAALFGDVNDASLFDDIPTTKSASVPVPEKPAPSAPQTKIADLPKKPEPAPVKPEPVAAVSLFDEKSDDALFSQKPAVQKNETKANRFSSLFGEELDDSTVFSGSATKKETTPQPAATKKGSFLFDDDSTLFGAKAETAKPASATKKASVFGDDEESDPFGASTSKSQMAAEPVVAKTTVAAAKKSIFDSEDVSDPFGGTAGKSVSAAEPVAVKTTPAKKSVFDNEEVVDPFGAAASKPKLPEQPEEVKPRKSSFNADETNDRFEAAVPSKTTVQPEVSKTQPRQPSTDSSASINENRADSVEKEEKPVGKIGKLAAGIKIIMPGQTHPKFDKTAASPMSESIAEPELKSEEPLKAPAEEDTKSFESVTAANLGRATVTGKTRRAPSKKAFGGGDAEEESPVVSSQVKAAESSTNVFEEPKPSVLESKPEPEIPQPTEVKSVAPVVPVVISTTAAAPPAKKNDSLFDKSDDESDDEDEKPRKPVNMQNFLSKASSAPAVPAAVESEPLPVPVSIPKQQEAHSEPVVPKASVKPASLFDEDEPVAIVSKPTPKVTSETVPAATISATKKSSGLFGDDGEDSLFSSTSKATTKKSTGLFGEEDEPFVAKKTPAPEPANVAASSEKSSKPSSSKVSLFGDDDGDDIFASKSKKSPVPAAASKKSSSLFGDDDDDIFGSKTSTSSNTKKKSIFDD
jgi:hypothetical protein